LSFRGSRAPTTYLGEDWLSINAPNQFSNTDMTCGAENAKVVTSRTACGKAGTGFYNAYRQVAPLIRIVLQNWKASVGATVWPNYRFIITGHSLGAALAHVAALDLVDTNYLIPLAKTAVITFASPRMADSALQSYYTSKFGARSLRVANAYDIVPKVPIGGYHCTTAEYDIVYGYTLPSTIDPIAPHYMSTYFMNIRNTAKEDLESVTLPGCKFSVYQTGLPSGDDRTVKNRVRWLNTAVEDLTRQVEDLVRTVEELKKPKPVSVVSHD